MLWAQSSATEEDPSLPKVPSLEGWSSPTTWGVEATARQPRREEVFL